jgi:hypothetical protein
MVFPRTYDFVHGTGHRYRLFDYECQRIYLGLLFKGRNVTYDEIDLLTHYLNMKLYYSRSQPLILFFSRLDFSQQQLDQFATVAQQHNILFDLQKTQVLYAPSENWEMYFQHLNPQNVHLVPAKKSLQQRKFEKQSTLSYKTPRRSKRSSWRRQVGGSYLLIPPHDTKIASQLFQEQADLENQYISLFGKTAKNYPSSVQVSEMGKFSLRVYPYEYISPSDFARRDFDIKEMKDRERTQYVKMGEILLPDRKPISIIRYRPLSPRFFQYWEILQSFPVINEKRKIMEIANMPSFLEAAYYQQRKRGNPISEYQLRYLSFYFHIPSPEKKMQFFEYYKQNLPLANAENIENPLDSEFLFGEGKYDCISYNVSYFSLKREEYAMSELINLRILFYGVLYILQHLEKGGSAVVNVNTCYLTITADVLALLQKHFKRSHFYYPKIHNLYKRSGTYLVLRNFGGIAKSEFEPYRKLFDQLHKLDPTGVKFELQQPDKYIQPLLDHKFDTPEKYYRKVRNFNSGVFLRKIEYYYRLIELKETPIDEWEEMVRKEQLIRSIIWAREFDLEYIDFDPETFGNEFERLILEDMYSQHTPTKFKFTKGENGKMIPIPKVLNQRSGKVFLAGYLLDTRDITLWQSVRRKVIFYRPVFKEMDLVRIVRQTLNYPNISQAWLKMYEILATFPDLIPDTSVIKSFHFCEAPGNFLAATMYYVERNHPKSKLEWTAQSWHPKNAEIGDTFGLIAEHSDKWDFAPDKTGDITKVENIKYYGKYMDGVQFITADCGLGVHADQSLALLKVHYAQTLAILWNAPKGCNVVCKYFIYEKPIQLDCWYLLYQHFEKIYFYKPVINLTSREFYLIGFNYQGMPKTEFPRYWKELENFTKETRLFDEYPQSFILQVTKAMQELVNNFAFTIQRIVYYMDHYEEIEPTDVELIKKYIQKKNEQWLERVGLLD